MNGRNLTIFNNIARHTDTNDHILVIYGAGHSNLLRQLATDSGVYRIHDHWPDLPISSQESHQTITTADTLMNKLHTLALTTLLCMPLLACSKADQATGSVEADETKDFISGKIAEGINEAKKQLETENIDIRNINVEFNGQLHDRSQDNDARAKAEITPDGELLIDDKAVVTSAAQRAMLLSYRQEIIGLAHAGMDLGADAADLGIDAAKEALWGVFSGKDEKAIEAAIKPRTEKIETAAKILCARLPSMLASQQRLAAALPEFKPYATLEQKDVEDCGKDDDQKEDVAASK